MRKAFTLIELLIVIAIIAILSVVVVLTLNPAQLLMQARDSNRVSDLTILNTALGIYAAQSGNSLGSANTVYLSVPDPTATSSQGDQCQGLNLPSLPASDSYFCGASSTFRRPDGTGWIPVNLSSLPGGSPMGQLPIDAVNQTSSNLYYTYATNGSQFVATAVPESQKYKTQYASYPAIANYPEVIAAGTNVSVSPLFSPLGLVGYWTFEEGGGTAAADSGNGNNGSWSGSTPYYTGGKVGAWAGNFDGSTDYVNVNITSMPLSVSFSVAFWANFLTVPVGGANVLLGTIGLYSSSPLSFLCGYYEGGQNTFMCAADQSGTSFPQANFGLPTANTWYYYVLSYDGSNMRAYVNGSLKTTVAANLSPSPVTSFTIGQAATWFAGTGYMNGSLDDVRLYSRALSAAEISALYNTEK